MKNLKSLHLKNFQSHKDTRVDFSPNITMFLGESDTGKTSIFRMLELILKNQPRGIGFITAGSNKTTGTLTLEDDTEIVRERTKSVNRYVLLHPDGTSYNFEGFGLDVPPSIVEAFDHETIFIDHDMRLDLNFAKQLEGHFLLTENNATKAKIIDGLAKINVFNIALRKKNTYLTNLNLKIRDLEGDYGNIKDELEQYEGLELMEGQIEALDTLIAQIEFIEQRKEKLVQLQNSYNQIQSEIEHNEHIISRLSTIAEADQLLQNASILGQKKAMLTTLNQQFIYNEQQIAENERIMQMKPSIIELAKTYNELVTRFNKAEQYKHLHYNNLRLTEAIEKGNEFVHNMAAVKEVDIILTQLTDLSKRKEALANLGNSLQSVVKQEMIEQDIITRYSSIREAEVVLTQLTDLAKRREELAYLGNTLHTVSKQEVAEQEVVSRFGSIRNAEGIIQELEKVIARKKSLMQVQNSLINNEREIISSELEVQQTRVSLQQNKEAYASALKEMNKCPVCFGELSEEHLNHVVNSL